MFLELDSVKERLYILDERIFCASLVSFAFAF